jgi:hypothetical protein
MKKSIPEAFIPCLVLGKDVFVDKLVVFFAHVLFAVLSNDCH